MTFGVVFLIAAVAFHNRILLALAVIAAPRRTCNKVADTVNAARAAAKARDQAQHDARIVANAQNETRSVRGAAGRATFGNPN